MKPYESSWKIMDELERHAVQQQRDDMPLSVAIMIGVQLLVAAVLVVVTAVMQ